VYIIHDLFLISCSAIVKEILVKEEKRGLKGLKEEMNPEVCIN